MTRKQFLSLIFLGASIIYDVMPVDFIPDVPFIGWLDDIFVTSSAAINCLQQFSVDISPVVYKAMQWLKWICVILAVLVVIVALLLAGTIMTLMKG